MLIGSLFIAELGEQNPHEQHPRTELRTRRSRNRRPNYPWPVDDQRKAAELRFPQKVRTFSRLSSMRRFKMRMKTRTLLWLCIFAISAASAHAEKRVRHMGDAPALATSNLANELENISKTVALLQSDAKALQTAITNLATSQNAEVTKMSLQLTDMARRLYATCVQTQRIMDITVPGGWSENALCTYQGLTAAGPAVTDDIFGRNPTNIDTPFAAP